MVPLCFVMCLVKPGCFNNVVLPFAWSERVQGGSERYYDETKRERDLQLIGVIKSW